MNWLQEAFLEPTMVQAVIIISLVSALGLYLFVCFITFIPKIRSDSYLLNLEKHVIENNPYCRLASWANLFRV